MAKRRLTKEVYVRILDRWMPRCDPAYIEKVRSLSCSVCSRPPRSEAQHPRGAMWGSGGQLKAPDGTAIPLCHFHHFVEFHGINRGQKTWEDKYGTHEAHLKKTWKRLGINQCSADG